MNTLLSKINDPYQEAIKAKEYWKRPGTQTLEYRSKSHYVEAVLKFIIESRAAKILEFGCGSGRNLNQIRQDLTNQHSDHLLHLRGIDANENSINSGREKFGAGLDLVVGDEAALADEPSDYYDLVFTISVLDHLPNPIPVVRELISKTKRYAMFLEPVNREVTDVGVKIDHISTRWYNAATDEATPYTYLHDYSLVMDSVDAEIVFDIPMPTSVYKVGPFYRLYLVQKKSFQGVPHFFLADKKSICDDILRYAILTASSSLSLEQNKTSKLGKEIQTLKSDFAARDAQWAKQRQQQKVELSGATAARKAALEELQAANADAQAKEAQWAQQRKQLEVELSGATAARKAALEELQAANADAQAKEAQWAQQRKQLEVELSGATAARKAALEELQAANADAQAKEAQWAQQRKQLEVELSGATAARKAALEELQAANADAQAKEAQWAQQRKQLEVELSGATAARKAALEELQAAQEEYKQLRQQLGYNSTVFATMQVAFAEAVAESLRLSAATEMMTRVNLLEYQRSLSNRLGNALIEGWDSPANVVSIFGKLYTIWQESRAKPTKHGLGGDSFDKVSAAYANGNLDNVEKLLLASVVPDGIKANAYTALARHLRLKNPAHAAEAARRAYAADPRLFRRKWLVFRLFEAGQVLEADALLTTLPEQTEFTASETKKIAEIRGMADDERQIAARAKVDRQYLTERSHEEMAVGADRQNNAASSSKNKQVPAAVWNTANPPIPAQSDEYYAEKCRTDGVNSVAQEIVRTYESMGKVGANECIRVAKLLCDVGMPEAEFPLMKAAKELHASPATLRSFFWAAQRAKKFTDACDAIHKIEQMLGDKISADEAERLKRLKVSPAYQLTVLRSVEPRKPPVVECVDKRLCYVLHNSLPYSSGGYATRSQGVAGAMAQAGFEVIALTRPGFPLDAKPELKPEDVALSEDVEGIRYERILSPLRVGSSMLEYVQQAADTLEAKLRELKPEIVMAASNHVTGLPALIAARRLGLKFIYEVRGLWEITRMSREASFENTPAFVVQSLLEAAVCKEADHVFTLTEPMRAELIMRGVEAEKISLLPNSCDPDRFIPREKDASLAKHLNIPAHVPVIGYVGTFVDYEGLEDLASACALLKQQGVEFRLLLVGNENASGQGRGPISEQIIEIANTNGFSDWLIMPGRVPHEEVHNYYSQIDIAPFPRKPWPVCEMVSPIKPLEALAMEKAVVVSSVRALNEMVKHKETGLVFQKGNTASLAQTLLQLINEPGLRGELGKNGRAWVESDRTWRIVGQRVRTVIEASFSYE